MLLFPYKLKPTISLTLIKLRSLCRVSEELRNDGKIYYSFCNKHGYLKTNPTYLLVLRSLLLRRPKFCTVYHEINNLHIINCVWIICSFWRATRKVCATLKSIRTLSRIC